ncbi:hypothetical protein AAG570_013058 [Ranatra chinensis]|uniref:Beclin-1 n=1 Tax=Ranatra chinensis TaxID=642074 RepID=A0ABD0YG70_9HEMI
MMPLPRPPGSPCSPFSTALAGVLTKNRLTAQFPGPTHADDGYAPRTAPLTTVIANAYRMNHVTADLFDIVSSNSEVDHPLCEECTDTLLELMDQQLKLTEDELNDYTQFLKRLESDDTQESLETLTKEMEHLQFEEERLMGELAAVQEEDRITQKQLEEQEKEKERLGREEESYRREYSKHKNEYIFIEDEHKSLECQLAYAKAQLDKLEKTNVFNATFHIWHSGHFGTINNFRLGRLPSAPVDWSEINAAWGQTALLLTALATKMNLTFDNFRLVPYGNHSYIEVLSERKELPLYGSGGMRFLWDTKFDAAMVAFLECLQQFKEEVEKEDSDFCLPYRIDKGKLEDSASGNSYSVKIQFNSEEQWTKALKFLLTNLKWGLAWVSSQFGKEQNESCEGKGLQNVYSLGALTSDLKSHLVGQGGRVEAQPEAVLLGASESRNLIPSGWGDTNQTGPNKMKRKALGYGVSEESRETRRRCVLKELPCLRRAHLPGGGGWSQFVDSVNGRQHTTELRNKLGTSFAEATAHGRLGAGVSGCLGAGRLSGGL